MSSYFDKRPALKKEKVERRSSGELAGGLPDDVMLILLSELPAKSLLRLRCVSKAWRSTIDNPRFVDMHRLRSHERRGGVMFLAGTTRSRDNEEGEFLLLDHHQGGGGGEENEHDYNVQVVPQPDPSFKASHLISHPDYFKMNFNVVEGLIRFGDKIWNPTTRKCFDLPPQNISHIMDIPLPTPTQHLPCLTNQYYLGFDSIRKEYKVLSIICVQLLGRKRCHIQVITLGGDTGTDSWNGLSHKFGSWRDITHNLPREAFEGITIHLLDHASLYLNNKIYIVVRCPIFTLMVFSLEKESLRFIHIPIPQHPALTVSPWVIIEVRGCVALMSKRKEDRNIWRLINEEEEGEEKWEKITYVTWPRSFVRDNRCCYMSHLVRCAINKTETLVQLWDKNKEDSISYYWDIRERKIRKAPRHGGYIFGKLVETLFHPAFLHSLP